jgi:hypothetical protein
MADNTIRVLFRYRDLVAETIKEHQNVIDEHQACWWGWWKRPSEGDRRHVWDLLDQRIRDHGEVTVGLFNSGGKSVTPARITKVISPETGATALRPPEGEDSLVPEYYRTSPFSRAWMKIEHFGEEVEFFRNYSYSAAPELPHIPEPYLRLLKDKLIIDEKELRAMDTTIWEVRPAKEDDSDETFLAPGMQITDPVSADPIKARGNQILHLTDLHFAADTSHHMWSYSGVDGTPTLADSVKNALGSPLCQGSCRLN